MASKKLWAGVLAQKRTGAKAAAGLPEVLYRCNALHQIVQEGRTHCCCSMPPVDEVSVAACLLKSIACVLVHTGDTFGDCCVS